MSHRPRHRGREQAAQENRRARRARHPRHRRPRRRARQPHGHYDLAVLSPGIDPAVPLVQNFHPAPHRDDRRTRAGLRNVPVPDHRHHRHERQNDDDAARGEDAQRLRREDASPRGNIGPAFSATVRQSKELDVMTLEVSSFQLETIQRFPRADRRLAELRARSSRSLSRRWTSTTRRRSASSKTRPPSDWAVVNFRDKLPPLDGAEDHLQRVRRGRRISSCATATIHFRGERVLAMAETKLRGAHNAENLMAALGVGLRARAELRADGCRRSRDYQPLPHRCEIHPRRSTASSG